MKDLTLPVRLVDTTMMASGAISAVSAGPDAGLLERDEALAELVAALAAVQATSQGRLVLLSGEAGVGKTALLRWFHEQLTPRQRVLWGGCDPLFTPRPLGPLLAVAEDVGGELADVLSRGVMPHEVAAVLAREVRSPTLFVLEDVHWADEATLDLLRLLARRIASMPILIVASYRDDELDRAHPLRIVLGELATSSSVQRVRVEALSAEAVAQLAAPHAVDADELYRKTAGNPFFVVEALAAPSTGIPDTVRDAVLARAAPLSPRARQLLDAVAIVPVQAELPLLEALVGDAIDSLGECLGSGVLASEPTGVAFRHELARLAIEQAIPLNRKIALHRAALVALAEAPGPKDLARLAHHAEAAADADAVRRYAPAAAEWAASLGAHREAAAQYARALRHAAQFSETERAELLERRAQACLRTDQYDDGIAALEEAVRYRRALGQTVREADALRRLSEFLWCPGRTAESGRFAQAAVELLDPLPPGPELASAYTHLAFIAASDHRTEDALTAAYRAQELAESLGATDVAVRALLRLGACEGDYRKMEESLARSRQAGLGDDVGHAYVTLSFAAVEQRRHALAAGYIDPGIAYCSERGLELYRLYLLAARARLELDQGDWSAAAETAAAVLRIPRTSTTPRIFASVVLALVRARRGDPDVWTLLDDAWTLAEPTGELPRLGPVAAARAEAAWLEGRPEAVASETQVAFELAQRRNAPWLVGELACWRRRAGVVVPVDVQAAPPYALELAGRTEDAANAWAALGCRHDAALAGAHTDDEETLRQALGDLRELGAQPAAAIVTRRLRERGVRALPRGPRTATRENPAGLTSRELEVLAQVAGGLRNAEIAERLFVSEKTVDHHVSAILRKLQVPTRGRAAAEAARLGLVP